MKKALKRSFSVFLAVAIIFSSAYVGLSEVNFSEIFAFNPFKGLIVNSEAASEEDLTFTLNEDGESYSVSDCNELAEGEIVIPGTYDSLPVTSIGNYAFYNCTSLISIEIPDSITSMGNAIFRGCTGIKTMTIPGSIESTGNAIFYGCTSLESVEISDGVKVIGNSVFRGCTNLADVVIPESITNIGTYTFGECTSLANIFYGGNESDWAAVTIAANNDALSSAVIHYNATGHTYSTEWKIDIEPTCTEFGSKSHHCTVCGDKNDVTVIEATGHNYVASVEALHPHTVSKICSGCGDTISVTGTVKDCVECNYTIALIDETSYKLVSYIGTATDIVIPTEYNGIAITEINANCFKNKTAITSIEIPESITSIGSAAFYGCTGIKTMTIPGSIESIGNAIFYGCTSLESVEISDGVKAIGNSVFRGCTNLKSVKISDGVKVIGDSVFRGCTNLADVVIPESITNIGTYTFWECTSLANIFYGGNESDWAAVTIATKNDALSSAVIHYNATGHTYSTEWKIDIEPTCTEAGSKYKDCSVCGDVVTEVAEANGHSYSDWVITEESTCTETGSKYKECSVCGDVVTEVVKANGHSYSDWVITEESTCTETGSKYKECSVCGDVVTEVVKANGHSYSDWVITEESTCTENGSKYKECSVCGYVVTSVIYAHGHSYGDWIITTEATCTNRGKAEKFCEYCGDAVEFVTEQRLDSETYPNLEYGYRYSDKSYYFNYPEAKKLRISFSDYTYIGNYSYDEYYWYGDFDNYNGVYICIYDANGDLYGRYYGMELNYSTITLEGNAFTIAVELNGCGAYSGISINSIVAVIEDDIEALKPLGHQATGDWIIESEPDCDSYGRKYHRCARCDGKTDITTLYPLGHTYSEWEVGEATTCTEDGYNYRTCSVCDYIDKRYIDALGHDYSDWVITAEATCTNRGKAEKHCERCGDVKEFVLEERLDSGTYPKFEYGYHYYDESYHFSYPEAKKLRLSFSSYTYIGNYSYDEYWYGDTSNPNDMYICIYDANGDLYGRYYGMDLEYSTITLEGNAFTISIELNGCSAYSGISFSSIVAVFEDDIEALKPLGHQATGDWIIESEPDCDSYGRKYHRCARCDGKTDITTLYPLGHTYSEWEIGEVETCTEDGYNYRTCSVCDYIDKQYIDALGHDYSDWVMTYPPTCTDYGAMERYCYRCYGTQYQWGYTEEEIPSRLYPSGYGTYNFEYPGTDSLKLNFSGHGYCYVYDENGKQYTLGEYSTITIPGDSFRIEVQDDYWSYCSFSSIVAIYDNPEIQPLGHNYDYEWTIDVEPTCTENGWKSYHCLRCEDRICVTEIVTTGHNYSEWVIDSELSCTVDGVKHKICSGCDDVITETIAAQGHNYSEWIIDSEISCTVDGVKHKTCSICSDVVTETTPAMHQNTLWITEQEPTCDTGGYKDEYCLDCAELINTEMIPATGHSYGDWVIDIESTCTTEGSKYKTCSVCGDVETETVDIIPHSYSTEWTVDVQPTCTEAGSKSHHCTDCGDKADVTVVSATGHSYGDWVTDVEPTCTEVGSKSHHCTVCGDIADVTVVPATGHSYGDWITDVEPTCTESGYKHKNCSVCNNVATETLAAKGHSYSSEWTIDVSATCTEDGSKSHHCTACDNGITDVTVVVALGHDYVAVSTEAEHPHTIAYNCSRCPETMEEESYSEKCGICNFSYTDNGDGTCKVTGYIGSSTSFVLPATIDGKTVVTTNTGAFKANATITSVEIEDGVEGIGALAFLGCKSLSKIVIPESVTSIGTNAFYNCASDFKIYCYRDSYAMQYAIDNSLDYVIMDVGETDNCTIDYTNNLIYTTNLGVTNINELLYVPSTSTIAAKASLVSGNKEYFGTGSTVTVSDGNTSTEYTLVVEGDTNGDSVCDVLDAFDVERASSGNVELSGAYSMAADSNSDEVIDITDYQNIVNKALA